MVFREKHEFSRESSGKEDRLLRTAVVNKDGWLKKDEFSRESSDKEDRLLRTAAVNKYCSEVVSKCWRFFLDISSLELQVFWRGLKMFFAPGAARSELQVPFWVFSQVFGCDILYDFKRRNPYISF